MPVPPKSDLRERLIDAHAHFFFLKGAKALRVKLWQIREGSLIVETPRGAPMRKTVLGYLPTLDGNGVYEVEGTVNPDPLPDQMAGTLRIDVPPRGVKRINRRLYPRHHFSPPLQGQATPKDGKASIPIQVVNFSAGGLRVECARELAAQMPHLFRFTLEFDDESHDLKLPGKILYELPAEGGGYSYGIKLITSKGKALGKAAKKEAPVEALDQTVDLLSLVNRLLVRD